ncbi:MAG: hypothetical protein ABH849_00010 [Nanoarchaeota archaeon]|uniref:Uncharacterized protein n=1 Tax=viral metagenome TaxID=1070528 RepID=A0A6M3JQ90_9ZZZZ
MSYRNTFITSVIYCRDCRMLFEDFLPTNYDDIANVSLNYYELCTLKNSSVGFFYGTINSSVEWGAKSMVSLWKDAMSKLNFCSPLLIMTEYEILTLGIKED